MVAIAGSDNRRPFRPSREGGRQPRRARPFFTMQTVVGGPRLPGGRFGAATVATRAGLPTGLPAAPRLGRVVTNNANRFFVTDTVQRRVGTAAYRAVRRMAFRVRIDARDSMKDSKRRNLRYSSVNEMPRGAAEAWRRYQRWWIAKGLPGTPPLPFKPSRPGEPPNKITKFLSGTRSKGTPQNKFGIWAAPGPGVTTRSVRATFWVGPRTLPQNARTPNAGSAPRLHEQGGTGVNSFGTRVAVFPKRPYMKPALDGVKNKFRSFFREALAEDLRFGRG